MTKCKRVLLVLVAIALGTAAWAQEITGQWDVTLKAPGREAHGKASLKQTGDQITGSLGPEGDPFPITGTIKGNTLTIETHPQDGREAAFARAELTINGDKLSGKMDGDKGTIELVRSK